MSNVNSGFNELLTSKWADQICYCTVAESSRNPTSCSSCEAFLVHSFGTIISKIYFNMAVIKYFLVTIGWLWLDQWGGLYFTLSNWLRRWTGPVIKHHCPTMPHNWDWHYNTFILYKYVTHLCIVFFLEVAPLHVSCFSQRLYPILVGGERVLVKGTSA